MGLYEDNTRKKLGADGVDPTVKRLLWLQRELRDLDRRQAGDSSDPHTQHAWTVRMAEAERLVDELSTTAIDPDVRAVALPDLATRMATSAAVTAAQESRDVLDPVSTTDVEGLTVAVFREVHDAVRNNPGLTSVVPTVVVDTRAVGSIKFPVFAAHGESGMVDELGEWTQSSATYDVARADWAKVGHIVAASNALLEDSFGLAEQALAYSLKSGMAKVLEASAVADIVEAGTSNPGAVDIASIQAAVGRARVARAARRPVVLASPASVNLLVAEDPDAAHPGAFPARYGFELVTSDGVGDEQLVVIDAEANDPGVLLVIRRRPVIRVSRTAGGYAEDIVRWRGQLRYSAVVRNPGAVQVIDASTGD
jgi:hypothetical protein